MTQFHHRPLPDHSALLSGNRPPDEFGFQSEELQIWYNNTAASWVHEPEQPHLHTSSAECFIVLRGSLVVEAEGERFTVGPREYCCFPPGLLHAIVEVRPPVETLMIRAPSVGDKVYRERTATNL